MKKKSFAVAMALYSSTKKSPSGTPKRDAEAEKEAGIMAAMLRFEPTLCVHQRQNNAPRD